MWFLTENQEFVFKKNRGVVDKTGYAWQYPWLGTIFFSMRVLTVKRRNCQTKSNSLPSNEWMTTRYGVRHLPLSRWLVILSRLISFVPTRSAKMISFRVWKKIRSKILKKRRKRFWDSGIARRHLWNMSESKSLSLDMKPPQNHRSPPSILEQQDMMGGLFDWFSSISLFLEQVSPFRARGTPCCHKNARRLRGLLVLGEER